jgi:hypothetical protein
MDTLWISWILPDKDGGEATHLVNGVLAVAGQAGFDAILEMVKRNAHAAIVLELDPMPGTGKSVGAMLPFAARYVEFAEALGGRDATLEMR